MRVQRFTLQTQHYGDVPILRPVPVETREGGDTLIVDPWGILAPIRDHVPSVAAFIPVVSGEEWSMALHGHARPLMLRIGAQPKGILKMTPVRLCRVRTDCVMHNASRCVPHKKIPECWTPEGVEEEARQAVSLVTLAWAEGRYVVVVEGAEFSL